MTRTPVRPIPAHELSEALRIRPGGWRDHAECAARVRREDEPAWLWDDRADASGRGTINEDEHARQARVAHAIAICAACPVRVACLAAADPETERGVRGGWDLRDWERRHRKDALAHAIQLARAPTRVATRSASIAIRT